MSKASHPARSQAYKLHSPAALLIAVAYARDGFHILGTNLMNGQIEPRQTTFNWLRKHSDFPGHVIS